MNTSVYKWASLVVGLSLLVVGFVIWNSHRSRRSLLEAGEERGRTLELLDRLNVLVTRLADVEAAHEAAVLTGGAEPVQAFRAGLRGLAAEVEALTALTRSRAGQQRRLEALEVALADHQAVLEEGLTLSVVPKGDSRHAGWLARSQTSRGAVHELISEMIRREIAFSRAGEEDAEARTRSTFLLTT